MCWDFPISCSTPRVLKERGEGVIGKINGGRGRREFAGRSLRLGESGPCGPWAGRANSRTDFARGVVKGAHGGCRRGEGAAPRSIQRNVPSPPPRARPGRSTLHNAHLTFIALTNCTLICPCR